MKTKGFFSKKLLTIQMIFVAIFAIIFNMNTNVVYAYNVTHTQSKQTGINAFPDSYKAKLQELSSKHPNWTFTAYNTGMSWAEFISGESTCMRNTVHNSSASVWKHSCGQVKGGYACASNAILEFYADPRNFLTEERYIPIYGNIIQFKCSYKSRSAKHFIRNIYEWISKCCRSHTNYNS